MAVEKERSDVLSSTEGDLFTPLDSKNVDVNEVIKEGKAEILKNSSKNVFYNPVQEFNRDLSVAVLTLNARKHFEVLEAKKQKILEKNSDVLQENAQKNSAETDSIKLIPSKKYDEGLRILEALAATGLRSIRYAKEVPGIKEIIANDLSRPAIESLKANIAYNQVEHLVSISHSDASLVMYQSRHPEGWFDVIDLDPYGCPSVFLDGAVQAVRDGGLLMVTCTDMAILAGNAPETCYSKYGAISLRVGCCHEMALRIALQCIESHANRYGRYITPLLSVSADFYIRMFVRVNRSPSKCKQSISKLSMVYHCVGCETITLQKLGEYKSISSQPSQSRTVLPHGPIVSSTCEHCGSKQHMGGPIWTAPIQDKQFVCELLDLLNEENADEKFGTIKRLEGMLSVIEEELNDIPLYYKLDRLYSASGISTMPILKFKSALLNAGYRVSQVHTKPNSLKTDAPPKVVWDILRFWEKSNPVSEKRLSPGSVSAKLLEKTITTEVDFTINPAAKPDSVTKRKCRYQLNPLPYWGPGVRSIANLQDGSVQEKQRKNQGKNKKKRSEKRKHFENSDESEKMEDAEPQCTKVKLDEKVTNSND